MQQMRRRRIEEEAEEEEEAVEEAKIEENPNDVIFDGARAVESVRRQ